MVSINGARTFLIQWNNIFVLDKSFRKENNILFNSLAHRATCQIDIYYQYLEDTIFEDHKKLTIVNYEKENNYKKGNWLLETKIDEEDLEDMYDKIDIQNFNNTDQ